MREEINRVMPHYLAFNAHRELNLSQQRPSPLPSYNPSVCSSTRCYDCRSCTSRPITSKLHPLINLQWTQASSMLRPYYGCHSQRPRIHHCHRPHALPSKSVVENIRSSCLVAWHTNDGCSVQRTLCNSTQTRNLRPWEQDIDSEVGETGRNSFHYVEIRSLHMVDRIRHSDEMNKGNDASFQHASRLTFGPENSFEHSIWVRNTRSRFFKRCSTSRSGLRMTL
ncbi:hypothetical protein BGZ57DRAFT_17268 [Hyaloscypha finlandica]|nr:hypothetical protein BGZ57DRAFT_17268 [Hyaloscypha finlandica]